MKTPIGLALAFALLVTVSPAAAATDLAKELAKRGAVIAEETEQGRPHAALPFAELLPAIRAVQDQPCDLAFGRTVLKNPKQGLLGVLTGALGVKVAMDQQVAPEEGGMPQAFFVQPVRTGDYDKWMNYFTGQLQSNGSGDLRTALGLRRKARILKLQLFLEAKTGKAIDQVTDADVAPLRSEPEYAWLVEDVFEPVTVILNPELAKFLGRNTMQTGPAFGPLPTLNLVAGAQAPGATAVEGCAVDAQGRFMVRRTDSVVLLQDLDKILSIDGSITDDTLGDVVGHEIFHGIMYDVMGQDAPGGPKSQSKMGHDAPIVSDYQMAISEGWAELFEAWSGADNATFSNKDGKSKISRFLLGRQMPIRRNLYAQDTYEQFRSTKKTGDIKNGSQMMACEGLVAGVLYTLLTSDEIPDAFELMLKAFYVKKPQSLPELIQAMMAVAPDARTAGVVAKCFLYDTKFATVSGEARALYEASYKAKLAFLAAKNAKADAAESTRLEAAYTAARAAFKDYTTSVEAKAVADPGMLDDAVGPELWMDGAVTVERDGKKKTIDFRFNLNTVSAEELVAAGISKDGAQKVIEARDAKGVFRTADDFRGLPQEDLAKLAVWLQAGAKATQGPQQ